MSDEEKSVVEELQAKMTQLDQVYTSLCAQYGHALIQRDDTTEMLSQLTNKIQDVRKEKQSLFAQFQAEQSKIE